jgi:hexosaminidase
MLVPAPTSSTPGEGAFTLTSGTAVHAPDAPEIAELLRELLSVPTGLAFPAAAAPGEGTIALLVDPDDTELGAEGYRLTVTTAGVTASAAGLAGLRWAVQALRQLLPPEAFARTLVDGVTWTMPAVSITDVPRYPWRGAMLDVGRWHKPIEWLYTFADLAAMHRLNVFQLHLTEDQGWRFEVKRYPRLTEVGAFRRESPRGHEADKATDGTPHGGFYTQDQLRDLVAYAARRGVTIVPEVDLPGHTQAAVAAYPELGNDPANPPEVHTRFGVSRRVLNTEESTVEFVQNVLDELMDVFPSPYIHLGGDEVPLDEWSASPAAQARIAELGLDGPGSVLGWWIGRVAEHVTSKGRVAVVWDELVGQAPPGAVVMAWRARDRVVAALEAGHDVVATPNSDLYLNYPASLDPGEPLSIASHGLPGFGPTPLSKMYAYDPEPGSEPENGARVIGVQGNLWTEYAPTPERAEYDLMPRLAAVAEVAWGSARDEAGLRERLVTHLRRLDAAGIGYRPL